MQHKVKCDSNEMTVEMMLPDSVTDVYLEGMKEYGKDIGTCDTALYYVTGTTNFFFSLQVASR